MFLHEAKQIPRKFLLLRPRSHDNSNKSSFHVLILATTCGAHPDAFQRAVIVFTFVLCGRRRRRCTHRFLIKYDINALHDITVSVYMFTCIILKCSNFCQLLEQVVMVPASTSRGQL